MSPTTSDTAGSVATDETPDTELREPQPAAVGRVAGGAAWLGRFLLALFLFVGALQVMKTGAGKLEALQHGGLLVKNAASTLGLGWLGALLVLSGSPIAASALSLVSAGSINPTEGFTMVTGSRLGAAFVVLLVAVVYALRGGEGRRMAPVSTAVMALTATAVIYVPAALLGYGLLSWSPFQSLNLQFPGQFSDLLDLVYGDLLVAIDGWPAIVLFLGGLGILLVAFKLIDTVVPEIGRDEIERSRLSWMTSKWPMFALGCLVALIAMSVSVALTVLVPLVAKGYVKREDILPYIMGANITTLGDTLLAAFLLDSSTAVQIVLAGIAGTTLVSVGVLAFLYPQLKRGIWRFQRQMVKSKTRLFAFTAGLFLVPLALIGIAGVAS
jgi:solute carrier family 34 (sodium-dependent phosphate cotransporter)